MKRCFLSFSAVVLAATSGCVGRRPVEIAVAGHNQDYGLLQTIPYHSLSSSGVNASYPTNALSVDCFLIIHNRSPLTIYIGEEEFSAGYYNLELDIRLQNGEVFHLKKKPVTWFRNLPSYSKIDTNGILICPIVLDNRIWDGIPVMSDDMLLRYCEDPNFKNPYWDAVSALIPLKSYFIRARLMTVYSESTSDRSTVIVNGPIMTPWVKLKYRGRNVYSFPKSLQIKPMEVSRH